MTDWKEHPLYPGAIRVLRRIESGKQKFEDDQFDVAYLVQHDLIVADMEGLKLDLTEKGREALGYYRRAL